MKRDVGFAPNPFQGVCTLATCKPQIRRIAKVGDIVVACGGKDLGLEGRVVCIMRVSGIVTFQQYWEDARFSKKRPFFGGNQSRAYGDNIYHRDETGAWIQEKSHHSFEDGQVNEDNLRQDTSADAVLWSEDFLYLGRDACEMPQELRDVGGEDLYPERVRDRRSLYLEPMRSAVDDWFRSMPIRGQRGRPSGWE